MQLTANIIETKALEFEYSSKVNIQFPDLTVPKGKHCLILGNSGTGKTTLLNLLAGLAKPKMGTVLIDGQVINDLQGSNLDKFRVQHIGFIFQEAHLLKNLSLLDNIKLAQSLAKKPIDSQAIKAVLQQLDLAEKIDSFPNELSRGQLQRAAIARAVINKPPLLIADEPTAALDDVNTERVLQLLFNIADQYGSTLLITTHDKRIKDRFENTYSLK